MKKALLIGCGAEIGANLLILSIIKNYGFKIDTIVNQPIDLDNNFPQLNQAHAILARLQMAQPIKNEDVEVISEKKISVYGSKINLIFKNLNDFLNSVISDKWDLIILATSKNHLQDIKLIKKLENIGHYVFGMAESDIMTNFYPAILGFKSQSIKMNKINSLTKSIALGSCQTNGWLAQFRAVLEILKTLDAFQLERVEVDIVHPDTPTGRLGTKSFSPREQDARNNLRPSFSQIEKAMKRLIPEVKALHTVSLRVPVEEPGYQINRTYFKGVITKKFEDELEEKFKKFAKNNNFIMSYNEMPLGSKAYKFRDAICHMLPKPYLQLNKNCFNTNLKIHQMITQAYVSNVYGYCVNSLITIKSILN